MPNHQPTPEDIRRGATIKALREAYGLTQAQLGNGVNVTGRYIAYIEAGDRPAGTILCRQIAELLGVPLAAIAVEGYERLDDPEPAEAGAR